MLLLDGVNLHVKTGPGIWRIPFGFQLVPAGIMCFGLLFATESPRWLAQKGRTEAALRNLAHLRRLPVDHEDVRMELAGKYWFPPEQRINGPLGDSVCSNRIMLTPEIEIEASIEEERAARKELGLKEAFLGKGNWIRFAIAFGMYVLSRSAHIFLAHTKFSLTFTSDILFFSTFIT